MTLSEKGEIPAWRRRMEHFYHGKPTEAELSNPEFEAVCFVHIPKTGGTGLTHLLAYNVGKGFGPPNLYYCAHRLTDQRVRQIYGAHCRIALVLRDPVDRFVSAFYSRLNEGKPFYDIPLAPHEKAFFADYPAIEMLAAALGSFRKSRRHKARHAVREMRLLRQGYARYFGTLDDLETRAPCIRVCMPLDQISSRTDEFMRAIGFETYELPEDERLNTGQPRPELAARQRRILSKYLVRDYQFYDRLRAIAERLHGR